MAIKPNNLSQDELNGGVEILDNLNANGVALWLEGEGVCCSVVITESLRTTMHRHWAGLVCALRAQSEARQAIGKASETPMHSLCRRSAIGSATGRSARGSTTIRKPSRHSLDKRNKA
jgi:hypothetical protein